MTRRWPVLILVGLLLSLLSACGGNAASIDAEAATPEQTPTEEATEEPRVATAEPTTPAPTPTPTPEPTTPAPPPPTAKPRTPAPPPRAPESGQWIDVNVSNYTVRLMNGSSPVDTIAPVGVGREIDTGVWESTATGLFYVYSMDATLVYDAPYDTYISHWVGFDPSLANGFHSFLKGEDGKVVDSSTGNISNGCIRTGRPEAIYEYAEIGMPVWVHK